MTTKTTMTNQCRACYWQSDDRQGEVVLTSEDHADLSDDDLEAEARAEAARAGLDLSGGRLVIGAWRS